MVGLHFFLFVRNLDWRGWSPVCLKVKQVWFSLHPNSGCASFHTVHTVCGQNLKKKKKTTMNTKKYSPFFSLFWKVANLKPLQWYRIPLISISIPQKTKNQRRYCLLEWTSNQGTGGVGTRFVMWAYEDGLEEVEWWKSNFDCIFLLIFFPDSCCWIKSLSQQEHGVLLTTTWQWGWLDHKMIGTRQKDFGGVSALFYHHCLLGILFGVTFTLLDLTPDGSFPRPAGFISH